MSCDNLIYASNVTLADVVEDGFDQVEDGEGFDYTVGRIKGGTLKVVFEPDEECFESVQINSVKGFGYTLVTEEEVAE